MYIIESSAIKVGSFVNVVKQPEFHTMNITGSRPIQKSPSDNCQYELYMYIRKSIFCVCDIVIVITLSLAEAILLAPLR